MEKELTGKTALVTGGSRGIGRAICLELAARGANVALCYAGNEAAARETQEAIEALGVKAVSVKADVSRPEECEAAFQAAEETLGPVDILVNNAGITRDGLLLRMKEEDLDRVLEVNLKGTFHCMKLAARGMSRRRWGRIINMSSVVGLHGNAGQVNYAASKAGVIGMTKSLAKELGSRGVTVNAIAPGFIDTDMTAVLPQEVREKLLASIPLGRLGRPEDIARTAAFLAGPGGDYITGQVISVDGGMA
jgi:3-oxoacyl-[acyl-carrier protein] reductase